MTDHDKILELAAILAEYRRSDEAADEMRRELDRVHSALITTTGTVDRLSEDLAASYRSHQETLDANHKLGAALDRAKQERDEALSSMRQDLIQVRDRNALLARDVTRLQQDLERKSEALAASKGVITHLFRLLYPSEPAYGIAWPGIGKRETLTFDWGLNFGRLRMRRDDWGEYLVSGDRSWFLQRKHGNKIWRVAREQAHGHPDDGQLLFWTTSMERATHEVPYTP